MDRSNTANQAVLELADVKFDFTNGNQMYVTVPMKSRWLCEYHWHTDDSSCKRITYVKGGRYSRVLGDNSKPPDFFDTEELGPGESFDFAPHHCHSWWTDPSRKDDEKGMDIITLFESDAAFYRNICSAILDANKYPSLRTTPLWLRLLFLSLGWFPSTRERLVSIMLWVQLQFIHETHHRRTHHGDLSLAIWWRVFKPDGVPPTWVLRLDHYYIRGKSFVVHRACAFVGRWCLGMKGRYPEYTPLV